MRLLLQGEYIFILFPLCPAYTDSLSLMSSSLYPRMQSVSGSLLCLVACQRLVRGRCGAVLC